MMWSDKQYIFNLYVFMFWCYMLPNLIFLLTLVFGYVSLNLCTLCLSQSCSKAPRQGFVIVDNVIASFYKNAKHPSVCFP
jgi:hypothetical protein